MVPIFFSKKTLDGVGATWCNDGCQCRRVDATPPFAYSVVDNIYDNNNNIINDYDDDEYVDVVWRNARTAQSVRRIAAASVRYRLSLRNLPISVFFIIITPHLLRRNS